MSQSQSSTLALCISELESRTRAEVVLSLQGSSGNYRDVDHRVGAIIAFGFLLFALLSSHEIHAGAIPLPMACLYGLGLFSTRFTPLRVLLTRRSRRDRQVLHAAQAAFARMNVHQTRGRTGVLIYSSRLERKTIILADCGAEVAFPPELRAEYEAKITTACCNVTHLETQLGEVLRTLGVHLERTLPPEEDSALRTNELPDQAHFSRSSEDEHA